MLWATFGRPGAPAQGLDRNALAAAHAAAVHAPWLRSAAEVASALGAAPARSVLAMLVAVALLLRHRAAAADGSSFPSGHAMGAAVLAGAVAMVLPVTLGPALRVFAVVLAVVAAAAVAASRVVLGLHYWSDVAAGVIVGVLWLQLSAFVVPPSGTRRHGRPRLAQAPVGG